MIIDRSRSQLLRLLRLARTVRGQKGVSITRQFLEALYLRRPPGCLGLSEYFDYRLFDRGMSLADKRRFVGWRGEPALDRANDPAWHIYADDKLELWHLLTEASISQPRIHCVFSPTNRECFGIPCASSGDDLATWLQTTRDLPLFAKPAHGGFGHGAYLIEGHDAKTDSLKLSRTGVVAVRDFVATLNDPEGLGYLFQEVLKPHPALAGLTCGRLSTVRVMTLAEPNSEAAIYRAVWKVPRQDNVIDNFENGTTGNLLGQLDMASGRVIRVIEGYGLDLRNLDHHPDSGRTFNDLILPDWQELKALTVACARLMPGFRFQHWDMAITDRGPVPLEVNLFAAGGTELSQLVEQRGLLEDRLLAACRSK